MTTDELNAGWGKSPASRKWHYFPAGDTFALCRKVGLYQGPREAGNDGSPDNCAECRKRKLTLAPAAE